MTDAATPETATASEVHDLDSAARAIEKIIRREQNQSTGEGPSAGGEADRTRSEETDSTTVAGDDAADNTETEHSDDENDGWAPDDHDEDDEPSESDQQFTVKIDGKSEQVGVKELIKGYQRNADYTRKTMRLADERRSVEEARARLAEERGSVEEQRRHYTERLDRLAPDLRRQLAQFEGIDWTRLATDNPALFAQARPIYDGLAAQLRQTEAEQLALHQQNREQHARQFESYQQHLADQKQALLRRHPELADPAAGRKETAALTRYLRESGYRQDELSRLVDHRDFILARKAMLYDRLMANRDKVKETIASLPRVQSPGTARSHRAGASERRASLMRRLERTGRTEDAARLIEEII